MTKFNGARTICACPACVACCTRQPGSLAPGDFERIADHLGEDRATALAHFWASPGAVVADVTTGNAFRIGTITPRMENGRCVFLDEADRCRVHAVAPFGCAMFDVHMDLETAMPRSRWLIIQQTSPEYQALRDALPPATSYNPASY